MMARAAVPLGFMPDPARLADGVLDIVICSAEDVGTITVDATGNPLTQPHTDPGPVHNGLCPFAAAAALALVTLAVVLFGLFRWPARIFFPIDGAYRASPSSLGPLGPRAPPLP